MFRVFIPKVKLNANAPNGVVAKNHMLSCYQKPLLAFALAGSVLFTGCQQQSADNDKQTTEQTTDIESKPAPLSDSAAARIEQLQPLYLAQMQGLQRRLQAEYESLQAADVADGDNTSLIDTTTKLEVAAAPAPSSTTTKVTDSTTIEINTNTKVGERDLEVLKRISLEPREPKVLTDAQIIEHYQQAIQALYQPVMTPLTAEESNTLLNIATLLPQLFEDSEIAERLTIKSPALARIIVQHQVWQQIEVQQALDMQQMKKAQQQEFEGLMTKFNETIKDYDEQIAKYQQTLKEFQ